MIKNAYNKIKAVIEHGHYARVQFRSGVITIFSSVDIGGNLRCGYDSDNYPDRLGTNLCVEKDVNTLSIVSIPPLPRPFKKLKVGDKVIILENLREIEGFEYWADEKKEMVSNVFRVEGVFNSYDGVYYEINGYHFPHNCVAPYFEDDETEQLEKIDVSRIKGHTINMDLNGKACGETDGTIMAIQENAKAINKIIDFINAFKKEARAKGVEPTIID